MSHRRNADSAQAILETTLDDFLNDMTKSASEGRGQTSHVSDDADPKTKDNVGQGSHGSQTDSKLKEDVPANTHVTKDNKGGEQDSLNPDIGVNQSSSGKDPATEDDYKKDKEDPDSSHPSHNVEDGGSKYASWSTQQMSDRASKLANELLAAAVTSNKSNQEKQAGKTSENEKAAQAGYNLAENAGDFEKQAQEFLIERAIKQAEHDADIVWNCISGNIKQAMDEQLPPELAAALAEGGEGGEMPPEVGMPPMTPAPVADGAEGEMDLPPDPAVEEEGGDISEEEALQALASAMQDMELGHDELAAAGDEGEKIASMVRQYRRESDYIHCPPKNDKEAALRLRSKAALNDILSNNKKKD